MRTSDFDYHLPKNLIAQRSVEPRDHSRLMVIDRLEQSRGERQFRNIIEYLRPGDLIVRNNSKVFKARLIGNLVSSTDETLFHHDKPVEVFLVRPMENRGVWQVLAKPGKHFDHGMRVRFAPDFYADVMLKKPDGTILVQFSEDEVEVRGKANRYGHIPVPPYVKGEPDTLAGYQTVYASDEKEGSVAAPTSGFHFTDELFGRLREKGIDVTEVTLHVGLGTFLQVKTEQIEEHRMHSEWVEVNRGAADSINRAKAEGRRVVAIGTTTVRTLEGVARIAGGNPMKPYVGDIDIFVTPGFEFRVVDALVTNFHLPKSTLLMLVAAFTRDTDYLLSCYNYAVEAGYRFFSFGDAMFIH